MASLNQALTYRLVQKIEPCPGGIVIVVPFSVSLLLLLSCACGSLESRSWSGRLSSVPKRPVCLSIGGRVKSCALEELPQQLALDIRDLEVWWDPVVQLFEKIIVPPRYHSLYGVTVMYFSRLNAITAVCERVVGRTEAPQSIAWFSLVLFQHLQP